MATDLTTIFGNDINVVPEPRTIQRDYHGFAGADGLLSMYHGFRGYRILVTGRNFGSGATYNLARAAAEASKFAIEANLPNVSADYTFKGSTYSDVVFERFELVRDGSGKAFHLTAEGIVIYDFIAVLRSLN